MIRQLRTKKMNKQATARPTGSLGLEVIKAPKEPTFFELVQMANPLSETSKGVRIWKLKNLPNIWRGLWRIGVAKALKIPTHYGTLYLKKIDSNGVVTNYGLASTRVVTDAGVDYIVDAFQNSVELEIMKFHALGTGVTAEAAGDTALVTELTTEYTGNVRATGTTAEGSSTNIYQTVATNTLDGTPGAALREHGIFNQAATGGGVLLDRTLFSAITLSSGDALQTTYELTVTAGG